MHKFKKAFGQNFLRNDRFAHKLVEALSPTPDDLIIEIGPGDGRVTRLLLETGAQVVAIEVDYDLIPKLIMKFRDFPNFKLINESITEQSIPEILNEFSKQNYKVVGSLPYNISKQIISKFFEEDTKPTRMAFIVQEEVAKTYAAQPPKASFLSNYANAFANTKKLVSIPNTQFFPVPKVNGAIITFDCKETVNPNLNLLVKLLRIGFASPRKTLKNNLGSTWHEKKTEIDHLLSESNLKPTARPAELTESEWEQLTQQLISSGILK